MDWQAATRLILERLDLRAEYAALGVEVVGNKPSATGWLACRVFGAGSGEDRNPSAGVNVDGKGPALGRYKEFTGEGRNLSFFEFAAIIGKFTDWKEARKYYAKQTKTKLPRGNDPESVADKLVFRPGREHQIRAWCQTKPPITEWAAIAAGACIAGWPAVSQQFTVVALPMYGSHLTDAPPTGWVIWNKTGRTLPLFQGTGVPPLHKKMLTVGGSESGWMGQWGLDRLADAEVVWKTEGPTDMLTAMSIIPDELREKHVVIANGGGSREKLPKEFWVPLAGKILCVVHDCDDDGQAGGAEQAQLAATVACEVRYITLPYEIVAKHGKDLRDWISEHVN